MLIAAIIKNTIGEKNVPSLSATAGDLETCDLTIPIPIKEQNRPSAANHSGKNMRSVFPTVAAIAIEAIIAPQYDSKISEPIPAISPTLSPTLSAITPGFLGSSSGIPASIFPTKSAPTSALFV